MAKFYVQSGSLKKIVHSADADRASLWVIQRAMEPVLPERLGDPEVAWSSAADFVALGPSIRLSEFGFDDCDGQEFDTLEIFRQWCEWVGAIDQMNAFLEPAVVD